MVQEKLTKEQIEEWARVRTELRKTYMEREKDNRESVLSSYDLDAMVKELCAIIDYRPDLKIYNGILPTDDEELHRLKKSKTCQGVLILFDHIDGDITDLKEIVRLHPMLKFNNGYIPTVFHMDKLLLRVHEDGYLILFKPLNEREKADIIKSLETANKEVDEGEATAV